MLYKQGSLRLTIFAEIGDFDTSGICGSGGNWKFLFLPPGHYACQHQVILACTLWFLVSCTICGADIIRSFIVFICNYHFSRFCLAVSVLNLLFQ